MCLEYLKGDYDQRDQCDMILTKAMEGKTTILTSSLTLAEVLWLDPQQVYNEASKQKIKDFFDSPYIQVIDYTRFVAERARELKWMYEGMGLKDAGHLSTVIESEIFLFETFDSNLLKYDREFKNTDGQEIRIVEPFISAQSELPF